MNFAVKLSVKLFDKETYVDNSHGQVDEFSLCCIRIAIYYETVITHASITKLSFGHLH